MQKFMFNVLPAMIFTVIGLHIYTKNDDKYTITNKIKSKFHIKDKWIPFLIYIIIFAMLIILSLIPNRFTISGVICYAIAGGILGVLWGIENGFKTRK